MRRNVIVVFVALVILAIVAGFGGSSKKQLTIGFLYVGPKNDYGYNQAAYEGSLAIKKAMPNVKLLQAENVPETSEAERVMEKMIRDGATIIFPTSSVISIRR